VSISVGDGIVTLSGRVSDASERHRLTELVRSVASVKDVEDQLTS
jgi:osmotically-inducible protein OsmY